MIQVSRFVLSIYLLLTILVALKFNGCESGLFPETTVEMTNKLPNVPLVVHCKDKNHDLGSQTVEADEKWSFHFMPNPFMKKTLYFCSFGWAGLSGEDRQFDIYDQKRDQSSGVFQPWEILESGPCKILKERECFNWDNEVIGGGVQLANENNTIGV